MEVGAAMTCLLHVYLAGPMTGIPEFNFPAFDDAAVKLRDLGYVVFNPADNDRDKYGFDPTGMTGLEDVAAHGLDRRKVLADDLAWICTEADMVCVLPRWGWSSGARAEVATARALDIPVMAVAGLLSGEVTL